MATMDTLVIPEGMRVEFEPYAMFGPDCICITTVIAPAESGNGERAYWYASDGTNDIMQGETGTLLQAAQALINFAQGA